MKYQLLKVGSDAEFFVLQNATPLPICGRIGGTKQEPKPVLGGNGFAVQEDNVTLEFNIPPASTASEFASSIETMLTYLKSELAKQDLTAHYRSEEHFLRDTLALYPEAYKFGCEPDFCVWSRTVNPSPAYEPYMIANAVSGAREIVEPRGAGFHIHASYLVDDQLPTLAHKEFFVKAQDLFLGTPLTMLEIQRHSRDVMNRRRYYGKAGAFRPKDYGHEYRVLGSSVLSPDRTLNEWIFAQMERSIAFLNVTSDLDATFDHLEQYIIPAINQYNMDYCLHVIKQYGIRLP